MPYKDKERQREYYRQYAEKHPEWKLKYAANWRKKHPEEAKISVEKWRQRNPEKMKTYRHNQVIRRKQKVFFHYGNGKVQCACCGETTFEFLTVHHLNGGGSKHRREIGCQGGDRIYRWLVQNNFPDGFQVLCMNCNWAIGQFGYCPHEKKGEKRC